MTEVELLNQRNSYIEQNGPDTIIHIPEELGGGDIVEEDYVLSTNQVTVIFSVLGLPMEHDDEWSLATIKKQSLYFKDDLEIQWENKDALRILSPIATLIQAKEDLGRELTNDEQLLLFRFQQKEARIDRAMYNYHNDPDAIDRLAYSRERKDKFESKKSELERRKEGGMLYDDGSANSPAVKLRKQNRRDVVLSGGIFTSEYRASRLGGITLDLLDGEEIAEEYIDEIAAVACIDAKLAGRPVMTPAEYKDLEARANVELSRSSHWTALEARRMQPRTARARLTTGDGVVPTSRPKPGV